MFLITEIKAWNFISPLLYLRCLCPLIGTNGFGKHDYCGICTGRQISRPAWLLMMKLPFWISVLRRASDAALKPSSLLWAAGASKYTSKSLTSFLSFFFFPCVRARATQVSIVIRGAPCNPIISTFQRERYAVRSLRRDVTN